MPIYKMMDKNNKPIKKDGLQKYRVRINYIDNLGKSKQIDRVAYGTEAAKQLEMELNHSVKNEQPAAKLTVKQLYNEYINAKKHEVRETTLDKSKTVLTIHVIPLIGDYKIDKLTIPVLENWKRQIEDKGLSIRMRKNIYSDFRAMLNYAVKMEYLQRNPLLKVGNFKAPMEMKEEMQFYTPEEFQKFITEAKSFAEQSEKNGDFFQWNYYVFFCIAFYMGMRKGEIYALNWTDIRENCIYITKSLSQKLKGEDRITPPKNKSSIRTIEMPIPLITILNEHHKRCKEFSWYSDKSFICGGDKAIRDTSVQNVNDRFAKSAGVKQIRIHDFRHSHASLLANEGINIQEIARRLGHSNAEITLKTYSHLYPREAERAINVLNKIEI